MRNTGAADELQVLIGQLVAAELAVGRKLRDIDPEDSKAWQDAVGAPTAVP
jgi:hypothetical protein